MTDHLNRNRETAEELRKLIGCLDDANNRMVQDGLDFPDYLLIRESLERRYFKITGRDYSSKDQYDLF